MYQHFIYSPRYQHYQCPVCLKTVRENGLKKRVRKAPFSFLFFFFKSFSSNRLRVLCQFGHLTSQQGCAVF